MECSHKPCYLRAIIFLIIGIIAGYGITKFYIQKKETMVPVAKTDISEPKVLQETMKLNDALKKLWADHVFWTRLYIISAVRGNEDSKAALNRLMKNQEDLGKAIVPVYGEKAGQELTRLLKEHISIAGAIVSAAINKQKNKVDEENKKWSKNAEEIAEFLSKANPNWSKEDLVKMLNNHLKLTSDELTARLNKKWDDDVKTFDKIFDQALSMADTFTQGIIKQKYQK